jgi:heme exporter protein A
VPERITGVRLAEVRKIFGRSPALSGVTCTFAQGQISLVMGPNGAGKSTLLSILSTLSRPTSGQVLYGERSHPYAEAKLRGRIGLVSHAPMLYRQMSSRENLLFFARLYAIDGAERAVSSWLERVGMTSASEKPIQQLSRGMVQRVAFARALLLQPDLLLLDEPFSGLDRESVELLREELGEVIKSEKIVVLVTHDVEAVDGLCGHLLILKQGRTVADIQEPALRAARVLEHYHAAI